VQTETGLKTAKRPQTAVFCSPVRSFSFWEKADQVRLRLRSLSTKKPDWTGLLNTTPGGVGTCYTSSDHPNNLRFCIGLECLCKLSALRFSMQELSWNDKHEGMLRLPFCQCRHAWGYVSNCRIESMIQWDANFAKMSACFPTYVAIPIWGYPPPTHLWELCTRSVDLTPLVT
jgi:hypothetical protein